VATAVAHVLGHQPGCCGLCAQPALTLESQLLLKLLGLQDAAGWQKARHVLALLPFAIWQHTTKVRELDERLQAAP
jgi:hypothetical protein